MKGTWKNIHFLPRRSYLILISARRTCKIHKRGGRSSETHRSYPLSIHQIAKIESYFLIPFPLQTTRFLLPKRMWVKYMSLLSNPEFEFSVWNFLIWAGTGCSENRTTCSSLKDVGRRTGFKLGLHRAVLSPLLAQTALKTQGEGEKGRDNLSWLIPLSSTWAWEWGYRFQSLSELRSFEFWLLCAWKSGFYPVLQIWCSLK